MRITHIKVPPKEDAEVIRSLTGGGSAPRSYEKKLSYHVFHFRLRKLEKRSRKRCDRRTV